MPGKRARVAKRVYRNTKDANCLPVKFQPRFLDDADGRSHAIRELRTRLERLKTDANITSYQKEILAERAVFLVAVLETQEANATNKGTLDSGSYTQSLNCLLGLLKSLGLDKKCKQVHSLQQYVKSKQKKGKVERV
jgi:hypothetical protein